MNATTTLTSAAAAPALRPLARLLVHTGDSWAPTVQRVILGAVMLPHGLQKTHGLFGGFGFDGTMQYFTETIGLPWLLGFLVIALESIGAVALVAGFAARPIALGIVAIMVGAAATTSLPYGFFMNWFGNQAGEGVEYHILAATLALAIVITGAGRASIDRVLGSALER